MPPIVLPAMRIGSAEWKTVAAAFHGADDFV
jgi:hypothetical protein